MRGGGGGGGRLECGCGGVVRAHLIRARKGGWGVTGWRDGGCGGGHGGLGRECAQERTRGTMYWPLTLGHGFLALTVLVLFLFCVLAGFL